MSWSVGLRLRLGQQTEMPAPPPVSRRFTGIGSGCLWSVGLRLRLGQQTESRPHRQFRVASRASGAGVSGQLASGCASANRPIPTPPPVPLRFTGIGSGSWSVGLRLRLGQQTESRPHRQFRVASRASGAGVCGQLASGCASANRPNPGPTASFASLHGHRERGLWSVGLRLRLGQQTESRPPRQFRVASRASGAGVCGQLASGCASANRPNPDPTASSASLHGHRERVSVVSWPPAAPRPTDRIPAPPPVPRRFTGIGSGARRSSARAARGDVASSR